MYVSFVRVVDGAVGVFDFEGSVGMLVLGRGGILWVHRRDDEEPAPRLFVEIRELGIGKGRATGRTGRGGPHGRFCRF